MREIVLPFRLTARIPIAAIRASVLAALTLSLLDCAQTVRRDITLFGTSISQPARGSLEGVRGSGVADARLELNGEEMTGKVRFYWGVGVREEIAVTEARGKARPPPRGDRRMARVRFEGVSDVLECLADVDPHAGTGTGICTDRHEQRYNWSFHEPSLSPLGREASSPPPNVSPPTQNERNRATLLAAREAAVASPRDPLVQIAHSRAAWNAGQFDEAALAARRVLKLDRSEPEALWIVALSHCRYGRFEAALHFLERAARAGVRASLVEAQRAWITAQRASRPPREERPSPAQSPGVPAEPTECTPGEVRGCTASLHNSLGPPASCTFYGEQRCEQDGRWTQCAGNCTAPFMGPSQCCTRELRYDGTWVATNRPCTKPCLVFLEMNRAGQSSQGPPMCPLPDVCY